MSERAYSKLIVRVPSDWHRHLRVLAAETDSTIAAIVLAALEQTLIEAGKLQPKK